MFENLHLHPADDKPVLSAIRTGHDRDYGFTGVLDHEQVIRIHGFDVAYEVPVRPVLGIDQDGITDHCLMHTVEKAGIDAGRVTCDGKIAFAGHRTFREMSC